MTSCSARRSMLALLPTTLLAAALLVPATAAAAPGWKLAFVEKGVRVHTRPGTGGNMPEFRGTTEIPANTWRVLAVIEDVNAMCQWTSRCLVSRELRRASYTRRWFYHRSKAPWPFADRDAVLRVEVEGLKEGRDVKLRFVRDGDDLLSAVPGVVRIPVMKGMYRIRRLGPELTRVTMWVRMDPGGWIPDWAARWVSKRLPVDTLSGLRRQVARTAGRYQAFLDRWDPARRKRPDVPALPPADEAAATGSPRNSAPARPARPSPPARSSRPSGGRVSR